LNSRQKNPEKSFKSIKSSGMETAKREDSILSSDITELLASLRVGAASATCNSTTSTHVNLLATTDSEEEWAAHSTPPLKLRQPPPANQALPHRNYPADNESQVEIIDLVQSSDGEQHDWVPSTRKKHGNTQQYFVIDTSDTEDSTDDAGIISTVKRSGRFVLDDSDDESEEGSYADHPEASVSSPATSANPPQSSTSTLLPALRAILGENNRQAHVQSTLLVPPRSTVAAAARLPVTFDEPAAIDEAAVAAQAAMTLRRATSTAFSASSRDRLARHLYAKYNNLVFGKRLPEGLEITWNKRLSTTAGLTHYRRELPTDPLLAPIYQARIELSCKVIDDAGKLERTLVHEMCHVAAWLIDHIAKPPHGPAFKAWAARVMRSAPHLEVSTCHQYEIHFAYQWQCSGCDQTYGRHSNSIDTTKKVCGRCRGKLIYLGKFTKGGMPVKARKPSGFSMYAKENFARARQSCPSGTPAPEVMKKLASMYKQEKDGGKDHRAESQGIEASG
jgi:predicted SprT family Zn-dependent metalloprotease